MYYFLISLKLYLKITSTQKDQNVFSFEKLSFPRNNTNLVRYSRSNSSSSHPPLQNALA